MATAGAVDHKVNERNSTQQTIAPYWLHFEYTYGRNTGDSAREAAQE
jgi:hypothetical protein